MAGSAAAARMSSALRRAPNRMESRLRITSRQALRDPLVKSHPQPFAALHIGPQQHHAVDVGEADEAGEGVGHERDGLFDDAAAGGIAGRRQGEDAAGQGRVVQVRKGGMGGTLCLHGPHGLAQRLPGSVALQASPGPAEAGPPVVDHDEVTNGAEIAMVAGQDAAVHHHAGLQPLRAGDHQQVALHRGWLLLQLGKRPHVDLVLHVDGNAEALGPGAPARAGPG